MSSSEIATLFIPTIVFHADKGLSVIYSTIFTFVLPSSLLYLLNDSIPSPQSLHSVLTFDKSRPFIHIKGVSVVATPVNLNDFIHSPLPSFHFSLCFFNIRTSSIHSPTLQREETFDPSSSRTNVSFFHHFMITWVYPIHINGIHFSEEGYLRPSVVEGGYPRVTCLSRKLNQEPFLDECEMSSRVRHFAKHIFFTPQTCKSYKLMCLG